MARTTRHTSNTTESFIVKHHLVMKFSITYFDDKDPLC